MENARKLNSFKVRLSASNEGRGAVAPTISIDLLCTSVYADNLKPLTEQFLSLLDKAIEVQETVPSRL